MKLFISADIEGVTGIAAWDETLKEKPDYTDFRNRMTEEVKAACEGALNSVTLNSTPLEIVVKDAHDSARNIDHLALPEEVSLIRAFSGHPFGMMFGLDSSFDAALMIGYHAMAGSNGTPLAHTRTLEIAALKLNGQLVSEFIMNAYTAAYCNVPVIFVSGDAALCNQVTEFNPHIRTVATNTGIGKSVRSLHPLVIQEKIRTVVEEAIRGDMAACNILLPDHFEVELNFQNHCKAYQASFYPGVKQVSPTIIQFSTDDYFEVLRMLQIVLNLKT